MEKHRNWRVFYSSPHEYTFSPQITYDVKYCVSREEVNEYLAMLNEMMFKVTGSRNYKYVLEGDE